MKREKLAQMWGEHYPQPLAELIAVVTRPFDADDVALDAASVEAHKVARHEVKALFAGVPGRPSGGKIEGPLHDIARRLLSALQEDEAALLSADRLSSAISHLGDAGSPMPRQETRNELIVPESAKKFDAEVPFAMWR